jgi:hypothetical protein
MAHSRGLRGDRGKILEYHEKRRPPVLPQAAQV